MSHVLPCGHPAPAAGPCPVCRHYALVAEAAARRAPQRRYTLQERLTCVHRGDATGRQAACQSCDPEKKEPTYACSLHGECLITLRVRDRGSSVATCLHCDDRKPLPGMPDGFEARPRRGGQPRPRVEWVSTARLVRDAAMLAGKLSPDCAGVVGVPRSGMIPASVIAAHLHLPLYSLDGRSWGTQLGGGSRGSRGGSGPLVVVDDTVFGGAAMRRARRRLDAAGVKHLAAAVYVHPERAGAVDLYHALTPEPHVLEWNVLNSAALTGTLACDFDGVLCQDPVGVRDDTPEYRDWLLNAPPLLPARKLPVPLVVTGRVERYRPETEAWLARWGVHVKRLSMHPALTSAERDRLGDVAALKAREYAASRCTLFLESDPRQAEQIHRLSGKPAVCVSTGQVWQA